jgi:cytochrome c
MKFRLLALFAFAVLVSSCGSDKAKKEINIAPVKKEVKAIDPMSDKGVGPIKNISLSEIDQAMVAEGEAIFKAKCTACHKISKRFVGPGLKGVTQRRTPEWIMNMILNPDVMVVENPAAKQLLIEYSAPMANQSLTEDEARKILEYFRTKN